MTLIEDPKVLGIIVILFGILVLIYPYLVNYLVGIALIGYGLQKIFTN